MVKGSVQVLRGFGFNSLLFALNKRLIVSNKNNINGDNNNKIFYNFFKNMLFYYKLGLGS